MPKIEIEGPLIFIETQWQEKEQVKLIPGSRWDPDNKCWTLPLTWAACMQLRGVFGESLEVGPLLAQWSVDEFERRIGPALALRSALSLPDDATGDLVQVIRSWHK
jgi:hypothetical protein